MDWMECRENDGDFSERFIFSAWKEQYGLEVKMLLFCHKMGHVEK